MALFGLFTSAVSHDYTTIALRSFFATTPAAHCEGFVLIDNGGGFELPEDLRGGAVEVVRHTAPKTVAHNLNLLLARARALNTDLVVMSDTIVLTAGWFQAFLDGQPALVAPLSNVELPRRLGSAAFLPSLGLSDYVGHERHLAALAERHRATHSGFQTVAILPLFCLGIPASVYRAVGEFDPQTAGGAELADYALRAWLAGYPSQYALGSYVLRFQAPARSGQSPPLPADAPHVRGFRAKWGEALTYAFDCEDWNLFLSDPRLHVSITRQQFKPVIEHLRTNPSLAPFIEKQRHARFAAVCCVYDDDAWLGPMTESIYDACAEIVFLVGHTPWNGPATDQTPLVEKIRALPDPAGKIRVERGDWTDESTQRNAGLGMLAKKGIDYCLVVDADEVHDPPVLARAIEQARQSPQIDCWRMHFYTYWKSSRFRVEPPEPVPMPIFVRVGTCRFVENRAIGRAREAVVPPETGRLHHMSYARTNEQVRRKIETFSHASQMVPDWYENVWLKWDGDKSIENLNPCWPGAYRQIVEQPRDALPASLRASWDAAFPTAPSD